MEEQNGRYHIRIRMVVGPNPSYITTIFALIVCISINCLEIAQTATLY
jgi:hypothetical protein